MEEMKATLISRYGSERGTWVFNQMMALVNFGWTPMAAYSAVTQAEDGSGVSEDASGAI